MDIETYIKDHFKLKNSPVNGSSFITPNGLFVGLKTKGYDHLKLITELAEQGFKVNVDSEQIPEIIKAGWIRCNDGIDNNYAYIELGDITPTEQQFNAMDLWIPFVYTHQPNLTVIASTQTAYKEKTYAKDKLPSIGRFIRQFYYEEQKRINNIHWNVDEQNTLHYFSGEYRYTVNESIIFMGACYGPLTAISSLPITENVIVNYKGQQYCNCTQIFNANTDRKIFISRMCNFALAVGFDKFIFAVSNDNLNYDLYEISVSDNQDITHAKITFLDNATNDRAKKMIGSKDCFINYKKSRIPAHIMLMVLPYILKDNPKLKVLQNNNVEFTINGPKNPLS